MSSPIQELSEIETEDLQFNHKIPAMRELPPSTINDEYRRRIKVSYSRANDLDVCFIRDILKDGNCPE